MGKRLLTQPEELKEFINASGSIDYGNEDQMTAVAEAYLRMALHPSTTSDEALLYLKKGYKTDNVDPRFAYHIARIYFQLKEFNQARKWLMIAFGHCPTSHRIWVHIGLLQNELNLEFNKQNQFRKDDLKEKALVINEKIINKSDSIDISLLQFEPLKADKASNIQKDNTTLFDMKPPEVPENSGINSIHDFILNMQRKHAELLKTAFIPEEPNKQLNDIDVIIGELTKYGEEINKHIEGKLSPYCRLAENEIDLKNILPKFKLFYFYLDTLLRINILRRKIKDKSEFIFNSVQIENDIERDNNHLFLKALEKKISILDIAAGKKNMEELELEIDNIINKLKSTRKIDKNKCRWLGVYDISIENYLYNEASVLFFEKIIPLLEEVAKLIEKRPDGRSALAILCTEWLISGYSPQSIKRILEGLENKSNDEFISFIELVCKLFECEIEDLPELLATNLKNKNITPLVASLILKRRYLWREIDYEKTFEFKKSVQIINNSRKNSDYIINESEVNQYINILLDGLSGMWNPRKTPLSVKDPIYEATEAKSYTYQETSSILDGLAQVILQFNNLTEKLQSEFLKDFKHKYTCISYSSDYAYVLKHYEVLKQLENTYSGFVKEALELKKNAMSGLQKDIDDNLKGVLSEKEAHLTSELQGLKCCPQILKNIEKNLIENSSLNDKTVYHDSPEKILSAILEEAGKISASVFSKPAENAGTNGNTDILFHFSHLEKLSLEIRQLLEDLQVMFLKDFNSKCKKIENQDEFSYVLSNSDCLKSINSTIGRITKASLSAIKKLSDDLKETDEDKKKDFVSGKERIVNSFKEIESMRPKTGKYDSLILALGNKFERTNSEADKVMVDLHGRAEKIFNDYIVNSGNSQFFKDPEETLKNRNIFFDKIGLQKSEELASYRSGYCGIKGLGDVIFLVDQEIENILHYSLESFGFFDKSNLKNPYLVDLQIYFLNQVAETYFRLGLYKKAIKFWNHIIILKEIDPAARRNIAIAETMIDQSDETILNAWRKYCEDLYRCDILIGNPQKHAAEREEIHSKLSSVYAPFLIKSKEIRQRDEEEYKVKLEQFIALINNPAQFNEFIIHKIAELLNRRLGFRSPVLFLGLPISADEKAIKRASASMEDFIKTICAALPEKIRDPFLDLCLEYIKKSVDFCLESKNMSLARNPSYEEDKKKLHEWIGTVLELKETVFLFMKDIQPMTVDLKYIDIIFILDLLNRLPIDIDKGILDDMTLSTFAMYKNNNLAELREICANGMIEIPLHSFLTRISAADDHAGSRFYKQTVRILSDENPYQVNKNAGYIRFIDYPMNFLPDFVKKYIATKERNSESEQSKEVMKYLTDKCNQYPKISGFARLLSNIDFNTGKPFLKAAAQNAINRKIKFECMRELEIGDLNTDLISLKKLFNDQKYKNAYELFKTILERLQNKITIKENPIIDNNDFSDLEKNDLLLLTGRYYSDKEEIKKSMLVDLGIIDEELIDKIVKLAAEADISFLRNYLLNIIGGWIKSAPDDTKTYIEEFHKYLNLFKENLSDEFDEVKKDWKDNMNNVLINASIGHLGKLDSQDKLHKGIAAMKNLIRLDEENNNALYYLALFNQNLAGAIGKQSGINSAKEYFRVAYTITLQLKAKETILEENLKNQINQLFQNLEENKDIFMN
jgi:hypothetical protein